MKLFFAFIGIIFYLQALTQSDMDSARYYYSKSQPSPALFFARKSFTSFNDTGFKSDYVSVTSFIAGLHYEMANFDSALLYFQKAAEKSKTFYGESSGEYASSLSGCASMYMQLGEYQLAAKQFQTATTILSKLDSSHKISYAKCLIEYAGYCITTGSLNKAEELCVTATETSLKKPLDKKNYASALMMEARLYEKMGLYDRLDDLLKRVFAIEKQEWGEHSAQFIFAMGGLAHLYEIKGNLAKAVLLYEKCLAIYKQALGKNSPGSISFLNHLGLINIKMKKFQAAENYFKLAETIINKNGGEEFPLYPYCMKNLARLYVLSGRKKLAQPIFEKCLVLYTRRGLTYNSDRLNLLHDMVDLLYREDEQQASSRLTEVMSAENKLLLEKLDFLSETEVLDYLKFNEDIFEKPYRFLQRHKNPTVIGDTYNRKLLSSGISLQNTRALYQNMAGSRDSTLRMLWTNFLQQKSSYIRLSLTPLSKRNMNMDSLSAVMNKEEKEILRRSAGYRDMKEKLAVKWQDVQQHLLPGQSAIEFIRFHGEPDIYGNTTTKKVYYAALVIRPQDEVPQFVTLCQEKELMQTLKKFPWKADMTARGKRTSFHVQDINSNLYKLIWQPLEPYLNQTTTIYFSPDGLLHQIAFAAVAYKKDKLLCEKYTLIQLSSTRQVAFQETRFHQPASIAMFGGINYNHQSVADVATAGQVAQRYSLFRGTTLDSFRYLPGTLREINAIKTNAQSLPQQPAVLSFTADNATEEAFRRLGGDQSPEVIHFATHGFTLPGITGSKASAGQAYREATNPLLRCGLIMAGGNKGWKGRVASNDDDGILTGLEISSAQLSHTQLVVLSACETGLGKIAGSEGVFGLQRAFKLAGVNYIMASLWQVPDKETAEFMNIFYINWLGGKTIRQAFLLTQQTMRKKYAPYYWAGFTLVQ